MQIQSTQQTEHSASQRLNQAPAPEAFEQAIACRKDLYAAAMRYLRDPVDADDLVQETLMRAFVAWDRFEPGTNCRAWLLRILTNNFINDFRRIRKERNKRHAGEHLVCPKRREALADPENAWLRYEFSDEVAAALDTLNSRHRRVIELADICGLPYMEVAAQLGCPIGTVMSRLFRARRIMRQLLASHARDCGIIRGRDSDVSVPLAA